MNYDPITQVADEPLTVDGAILQGITAFRAASKLELLPGVDPRLERERLSEVLDDLADVLLAGIALNPSKLWVMRQIQRALVAVQCQDTGAREYFGMELERLMDVLRIERSPGSPSFSNSIAARGFELVAGSSSELAAAIRRRSCVSPK